MRLPLSHQLEWATLHQSKNPIARNESGSVRTTESLLLTGYDAVWQFEYRYIYIFLKRRNSKSKMKEQKKELEKCKACYYWQGKKKGCELDRCHVIEEKKRKNQTRKADECYRCPYGRVDKCIGICWKRILKGGSTYDNTNRCS